jgi:hypothetical protein
MSTTSTILFGCVNHVNPGIQGEQGETGWQPATLPDRFSIVVCLRKSLNRNGRVMDLTFTEATTMVRPSPGPSYEYAVPQSATLERSGGKWLVATVAFAPGSGMDGATCKAKSWAGNW